MEGATESQPRAWLMDMDGVLVHEEEPVPGADRFLARLNELDRRYLVLTNNSIYTPRDLAARLRLSGLDVPEEAIPTTSSWGRPAPTASSGSRGPSG